MPTSHAAIRYVVSWGKSGVEGEGEGDTGRLWKALENLQQWDWSPPRVGLTCPDDQILNLDRDSARIVCNGLRDRSSRTRRSNPAVWYLLTQRYPVAD
jgi:hypothetical protein